MQRSTKFVSESVLSEIAESGAIHTAYILEDSYGLFHIILSAGNWDYRLERKRGGYRTFKTIDAAAKLTRAMGFSTIRLKLNEFKPGSEPLLD
ncbi:MAG: hypothetical protein OQK12_18535 [Motiliproteus sp.]|nr:hypothetical protein [Motiliproteus sp.]MCW9053381.1 hypothetical protein [Motiliproteus sp.]